MCHCTAVPLSVARAMATDQNVLDCYFKMLTEALSDNGLLHRQAQIYNCNETGMPLWATSHKVVAKINFGPCSITSNDKTQVAVLAYVNAACVWCCASFCENNEPRANKRRSTRNTLWCF